MRISTRARDGSAHPCNTAGHQSSGEREEFEEEEAAAEEMWCYDMCTLGREAKRSAD